MDGAFGAENPGFDADSAGNSRPMGSVISAKVERVNTYHVGSVDELRVYRNEGFNVELDDLSDPEHEGDWDKDDVTMPAGLGPRFERLNRIYNQSE